MTSKKTTANRTKQARASKHERRHLKHQAKQSVRTLASEGYSNTEIARRLGLYRSEVVNAKHD